MSCISWQVGGEAVSFGGGRAGCSPGTSPWGRWKRSPSAKPVGGWELPAPPSSFPLPNGYSHIFKQKCHQPLCCPAPSPTDSWLCCFSSWLRSPPPYPQASTSLPSGLVAWISWRCHPSTQPPNSQGIHPTPNVQEATGMALGRVNRPCLAAVTIALLYL